MFIIADEDIPVVKEVVTRTIRILNKGIGRVDLKVDVGDGICPIIVTGYWVNDVLRLDIKIRK